MGKTKCSKPPNRAPFPAGQCCSRLHVDTQHGGHVRELTVQSPVSGGTRPDMEVSPTTNTLW